MLIFRIKYWYLWGFWSSKVNEWVSQHIEAFLIVTLTCFMGTEITWLSTQKDLKQENENSLGKNIFKAQIF